MSIKQHVEAHTTAAFRALIARTSEQARQELDIARATLQRHSDALAARLDSPLEPEDGERLSALMSDLARAAEDEALVTARAERAEAMAELQSQMRAAQAQAHSEIEAVRAAHQSALEAAAAAKAALGEALEQARIEAERARAAAQAEIEIVRADAERARVQERADVRTARAEAEAVRAEVISLKERQTEFEGVVADLQAQLQAEKGITASLSSALTEVRKEGERASALAQAEVEAARADAERTRIQTHANVEAARAEAEAARAEARTLRERQLHVEAVLADLQAQFQAERNATASLSSALVEVRHEAVLASGKAEAARRDAHSGRLKPTLSVHVAKDDEPSFPPQMTPVADGLRDACLAIDKANGLREVLSVLLERLAVRFSRAALFLVKGDRLLGWRGVGFEGSSMDLRNFDLSLTETSPLTRAVRTGQPVVTGGHLNQNGSSSGENVQSAVALPISIADSVVAVVYAENSQPSDQEPQRIIATSTLCTAEVLVERAVRRLSDLLTTSGAIPGSKVVPSTASSDTDKVAGFPQPGRSDDTRTTEITIGPEVAPREACGDRLGDSSGTARGEEPSPRQGVTGSPGTPEVPAAFSVGEDPWREPGVHGISSPRRIALVALLLVTAVAIASQMWVSQVSLGRRHAPAGGPLAERAFLQRVADGAPETARVDPAGANQRRDAAVLPSGMRELRGEALTLRLRASRVCWIRITADGQMVREGLMQGDEEVAVEAREAILLRIGDAGALSVVVNGRTPRSLGADGQVVALRITGADYQDIVVQQPPRQSSTSSSALIPQWVPIPRPVALVPDTSIERLSEPPPGG